MLSGGHLLVAVTVTSSILVIILMQQILNKVKLSSSSSLSWAELGPAQPQLIPSNIDKVHFISPD